MKDIVKFKRVTKHIYLIGIYYDELCRQFNRINKGVKNKVVKRKRKGDSVIDKIN